MTSGVIYEDAGKINTASTHQPVARSSLHRNWRSLTSGFTKTRILKKPARRHLVQSIQAAQNASAGIIGIRRQPAESDAKDAEPDGWAL